MQRHCLTAVIALTALAPSAACNDHPVVDVPYHSIVINECPLVVNPSREVDILFVIDNSGSMGEEQALLAANFERFIGVLEEPGVDADYRIAITTTDTGNLYCPQSDPENGAFVLESCVDRLDEFTSGDDDKSAEACLELCPTSFSGFGTTPTALVDGGERIARPWIERLGGQPNLPEEMDTVQAFQCFGPQGIAGCGFESPLEAMYNALLRTKEAGDPAYGFLRKDALLSIVFITDENDCSASPDGAAIFDPNGDHVFWSDPDAKAPTSAACWNAGVACDDSGCWSEDYAADGTATEPGAAVLHPLSRYVDLLREQLGKEDHQLLVSVIAGVPEGYPTEPIVYQPSADPEFQRLFGVGAGCTSATGGTASPPVRLKEFADAFAGDEANLFSICADDYRPALESIAERMKQRFIPACYDGCVADNDLDVDGVQADCAVTETVKGEARSISPCDETADGGWSMPAGLDICYRVVSGDGIHEQCKEKLVNTEFKIERAPGVLPRSGGLIEAECVLSSNPELECPGYEVEQDCRENEEA